MLLNLETGELLAREVRPAYRFSKRLKGLMFTKELSTESAMHIKPCHSIHTFFMNYAIDVLYLDSEKRIVAMDEDLPPKRFGKLYKHAASVIELPSGTIAKSQTKVGHKLLIETKNKFLGGTNHEKQINGSY
ncbi:DUF192 domain-containing protein [Fictibacillus sp. BK138]|uniref:DUF192 domain-containing protein n=1 Tax=Fictibacillus sp. BK138 TaxID=2512121 RepID=UPI0010CF6E48|nr:DUF192 domain-containing protein [Fictibacillus sp. BK138]RZT21089.1 hypothetical protein EV282_0145 [Fictibacillus sp. BK138]